MHRDFELLINCVIDDALLDVMPDIDHALLQFINVMNSLDPLLRYSPYVVVNWVQMFAVG